MNIKVRKTHDYKALNKAMKAVGSETHGHETNEIAWVAYFENKVAGVIGLRHLKPNYVIIDAGPAVNPKLDPAIQAHVLNKLLNTATKYARKYSNIIYTHNADEMVQKLTETYGFRTWQREAPDKTYTHPCLECKLRNKECFPVLLRKHLA